MNALLLALLLLAAVLLSSVIDQLVPRISLPLIQISLGILIAITTPGQIEIEIDPNLFLILFIAPLIYNESKRLDKVELWENRGPVLSLAIGLVVVTAVAVGFMVNAIIPSISLAAAIALGAALSPTDASAVATMAENLKIPKKTKEVIVEESIVNDASGIVVFQFAIVAAITGIEFNALSASAQFLLMFFGGIAVGLVLGILSNLLLRGTRKIGLENTTFHVLFEIFIPFIVYLVGNTIGVSAIMAVVAAGVVNIIAPRTLGPSVSRMNIVSSSVWDVLTFALNGIVFVLLGTQLPRVIQTQWETDFISNGALIGFVALITLALFVIRFAWVVAMDYRRFRKRHKKKKFGAEEWRLSAITALSGARGTITLSIALSIDQAVPQRSLIIFLVSGAIMLTLLISTFVVPLIAPRKKQTSERQMAKIEMEARIEILRNVISDLALAETPENSHAVATVMKSYEDRIGVLEGPRGHAKDRLAPDLRRQAIKWERDYVEDAIKEHRVDENIGYRYLSHIASIERMIGSKNESQKRTLAQIRAQINAKVLNIYDNLVALMPTAVIKPLDAMYQAFLVECHEHVISQLQRILKSNRKIPSDVVSSLINEYQTEIEEAKRNGSLTIENDEDKQILNDVRRLSTELELSQIQKMYEEGRLERKTVRQMRENVYVMQLDIEGRI
ncbi:MAG: sodium:proton antiporter [Eggerthellaceae bacterium]|nr:sodium:proton antiporter [Eggerthellaceae bacterium]